MTEDEASPQVAGQSIAFAIAKRSPGAWRRFWQHRLAAGSVCILVVLVVVALLAPILAPYDPEAISLAILAPPSTQHWLGTDDVGRDLFSRLMSATRISLTVGVASSILTVLLGVTMGALAGYFGGRIDALISTGINIKLAIPILPLALVLASFLETNLVFVVLIISLLSWGVVARIIRAEFLSLREREFVIAASATGASTGRIVLRHILPNSLAPIIVSATLQVASGILLESALSYLGFGIQPPQASWGNMLQNAQRYLRTAPALAIYPGALISLTVISINFAGDGLRDALDPRLRI